MAIIYKIFRDTEYADFVGAGETSGAPIDISDGYIHFSTADQVAETAAKHFAAETGLKLLAVRADPLGEVLIWEPSRGGALFPHLYRKLRKEDVRSVHDIPLRNGQHDFEGLLE